MTACTAPTPRRAPSPSTAGYHALRVEYFETGGDQRPEARVAAAGRRRLRRRPDVRAEHRRRRRAGDRPGHQVVRGRRTTRRATACPSTRCTRATRSPTCAPRASSRRSPGMDWTCRRPPRVVTPAGGEPRRLGREPGAGRGLPARQRDRRDDPRTRSPTRRSPPACATRWASPSSTAVDLRLGERRAHRAHRHRRRRLLDDHRTVADVAVRRQLPRVRLRPAVRRRILLPQPVGGHQPRRRHHRPAARPEPRHRDQDRPETGGSRTWPAACARRTASAGARTASSSSPTTRAAGCPPRSWCTSSRTVLQPLHQPGRPVRRQPVTQPGAVAAAERDRATRRATPVLLKEGPFAGQLLFGDVTYGGLQRGFLEKVDGEYQGAVFRHTPAWRPASTAPSSGPTARSTSAASARAATGASPASCATACRS